jgi:hypothetical protein
MVFCFVQNFFFSDNTRVRIFFFICRTKRESFFQNLTLGYMTNSESDYYFFRPLGGISEVRTTDSYGAPVFIHMSAWIFSGVCVAQSSVFCHTLTQCHCVLGFALKP